jgi:hypothetical protein
MQTVNGHPWDHKKVSVVQRMAVVQRLVQNTKLSYARFCGAGDSGQPLLTGGCCLEVVVSTGLTVLLFLKYFLLYKFSIK